MDCGSVTGLASEVSITRSRTSSISIKGTRWLPWRLSTNGGAKPEITCSLLATSFNLYLGLGAMYFTEFSVYKDFQRQEQWPRDLSRERHMSRCKTIAARPHFRMFEHVGQNRLGPNARVFILEDEIAISLGADPQYAAQLAQSFKEAADTPRLHLCRRPLQERMKQRAPRPPTTRRRLMTRRRRKRGLQNPRQLGQPLFLASEWKLP